MGKVIAVIVILLVILGIGYVIFTLNRPQIETTQPTATETQAYFSNLTPRNNSNISGQVRLLSLPQNRTLVTAAFDQGIPAEAPVQASVYRGNCDNLGEQVEVLTIVQNPSVETEVNRPLSELVANESVVIVADPEDPQRLLACGSLTASADEGALSIPVTVMPLTPAPTSITPVPTLKTVNTGWAEPTVAPLPTLTPYPTRYVTPIPTHYPVDTGGGDW